MKLMIRSLLVAVALSVGSSAYVQSPVSPPMDIYANFVGSWVGTDHYLDDGNERSPEITIPLRIEITESKRKNRITFAYTYGEKGQKDFSRTTRDVTLDASRAEMILNDDQGDRQKSIKSWAWIISQGPDTAVSVEQTQSRTMGDTGITV